VAELRTHLDRLAAANAVMAAELNRIVTVNIERSDAYDLYGVSI
jgi:hypothetical protein